MALHLNLHHEIDQQRKNRQRDPLKLAMLGVIAVAALFAVYYFYRMEHVTGLTQRLTTMQAEWADLEPKAKAAKTREDEIVKLIATGDKLTRYVEERAYIAPTLEKLLGAIPEEVQVLHVEAILSQDGTRKRELIVNGISTGEEPRKVAEDLRKTLSDKLTEQSWHAVSSFKNLEDRAETAQLDSRALPTAAFGIQVDVSDSAAEVPVEVKPRTRRKIE